MVVVQVTALQDAVRPSVLTIASLPHTIGSAVAPDSAILTTETSRLYLITVAAAGTITLPQSVASVKGLGISIKRMGNGTPTIAVTAGDSLESTLNGTSTLGALEKVTYISDGAGAWVSV